MNRRFRTEPVTEPHYYKEYPELPIGLGKFLMKDLLSSQFSKGIWGNDGRNECANEARSQFGWDEDEVHLSESEASGIHDGNAPESACEAGGDRRGLPEPDHHRSSHPRQTDAAADCGGARLRC